jgi:NADH dehydrogenase
MSGGNGSGVSSGEETQLLLVGAVSGGLAGALLGGSSVPTVAGIALGVALGTGYVTAFRPHAGSLVDHVFRTTALSVPAWILLGLTIAPLVQGGLMLESITAQQVFVDAGIWMGAGAVFSVGMLSGARLLELRPESPTTDPAIGLPPTPDSDPAAGGGPSTRIVIAGGGFAGLETAQRLEELFGPDPGVEIVLVSDSNSILFKPLLAEVAAGSLDPTDIATPLRTALTRTHVVNASVASIDPEARLIHLEDPPGAGDTDGSMDGRSIQYSHLVCSVGAETDYKGLDDVEQEAFSFTTIDDAIALRNHIINCLERAEQEPDPTVRESLLRVVIAGGGFAGAELAGALNDFIRDVLVHYPNIDEEEVELTIVHSGDRIMPELSDSLAEYAQQQMADRGVTFKLDTRVAGASRGQVSLNDGTELRTETLVWTAGVKPHPMLGDEAVPTTEWGAVDTESDLSVAAHPGLWAVGDCASMPRPDEEGYYPNTAEHGIRAAKVLAENIYAEERGGRRKPFQYTSPGSLVVVGYQTACAELFGYKFSGLFAWLVWRAVYLMKLPGMDRKHRVLIDWITELVFPREMAQTIGGDVLDADTPDPRSTADEATTASPEPAVQSGPSRQPIPAGDQPTKLTDRHTDEPAADRPDNQRVRQHE